VYKSCTLSGENGAMTHLGDPMELAMYAFPLLIFSNTLGFLFDGRFDDPLESTRTFLEFFGSFFSKGGETLD
jgi:hypothetical protein